MPKFVKLAELKDVPVGGAKEVEFEGRVYALFNVDGMGLPHEAVLEQIDVLGAEVVPVLRKEFAALRAPGVPDAPLHPAVGP